VDLEAALEPAWRWRWHGETWRRSGTVRKTRRGKKSLEEDDRCVGEVVRIRKKKNKRKRRGVRSIINKIRKRKIKGKGKEKKDNMDISSF
jgi:hypothetical protein